MIGVADVDEVTIVARHRLEPAVCRLNEDLRLVPGSLEDPLYPQDLVSDGIAVAQRGENLMDVGHDAWLRARARGTSKALTRGSASTTSLAGG